MKKSTRFLVQGAIIAAIYVVMTLAFAPISFGSASSPIQFRISEILTILPIFTPAAIPGLFIGCAVANINSPFGPMDTLIGSIATLIAAYGTYLLRHNKYLALLPPVICNGIIVGTFIYFGMFLGKPFNLTGLLSSMLFVAFGELVVCFGLGLPLIAILNKYKKFLFIKD